MTEINKEQDGVIMNKILESFTGEIDEKKASRIEATMEFCEELNVKPINEDNSANIVFAKLIGQNKNVVDTYGVATLLAKKAIRLEASTKVDSETEFAQE